MDGKEIYALQAAFKDKNIIVRLLGFDPSSGAARLAIDERHEKIGSYRITATFGSGNSAYIDYDGGSATRDNRPILQTPKRNDTLQGITAGPVPKAVPKTPVFLPSNACAKYKEMEGLWKSFRDEWVYFTSPESKAIRGTSDRKSKQLAREAKDKMNETRRRMTWHQEGCDLCKGVKEE